MSKIKMKLVLPLQEQAEELGFSTVQDALDNGYHVVEDLVTGEATLKKLSIDEQYEQAHEAWLKEKKEVLKGLWDCFNHLRGFPPEVYTKITNAIKFIEGVKYEQ